MSLLTTYELMVIFRTIPKDELAAGIKRVAGFIFEKGGFLRQLKYLGLQNCPRRESKNKVPYWQANYVFYEFNMPKMKVPLVLDQINRDFDALGRSIYPKNDIKTPRMDFSQCTFEEEMLPVPFRPQVIELVEKARRIKANKDRKKLKFNMGIDFYPFPR